MFTGGAIWILTHGQLSSCRARVEPTPLRRESLWRKKRIAAPVFPTAARAGRRKKQKSRCYDELDPLPKVKGSVFRERERSKAGAISMKSTSPKDVPTCHLAWTWIPPPKLARWYHGHPLVVCSQNTWHVFQRTWAQKPSTPKLLVTCPNSFYHLSSFWHRPEGR